MLLIECPECAARYNVNPGSTAKETASIKCPACRHVFTVSLQDGKPLSSPVKRSKVLIVDDSRSFRTLLSELLEPLDLEIHVAASGNEALQFIVKEHPQLVILDLGLPDINGTEIVKKVKAFKSLQSTRFLILSGQIVNGEATDHLRACGADDVSPKSFKPAQLRQRIKTLLEA